MYKIVIDSCGELTQQMKESGAFASVPLSIQLGDYNIIDDEKFDQKDFLKRVRESHVGAKSSCPSPEEYMKSFEGEADHVYGVTLSSHLSGSYNSAVLATDLFREEHGDTGKKIHIFNSKSASCGETLVGLKTKECEEAGMSFEDTVTTVESYIEEINTYFVLESLETLRKNGRLSNLKAFVASALNIKPIMGATDEGMICQLGQARGMNKALKKMVALMMEKTKNAENKTLAIAHCNCAERAQWLKEEIESLVSFKDIIILDTAGISSMYANDGGIIMVV